MRRMAKDTVNIFCKGQTDADKSVQISIVSPYKMNEA